jgi:paraquat-inducible protein B
MQQRVTMLTPQHIAAVRKGIRVRAAPVTAEQQQRLANLRQQLPEMMQRSTALLQQQRAATVQRMQQVLARRADLLRTYQARARRGVIEILEQGLQPHGP